VYNRVNSAFEVGWMTIDEARTQAKMETDDRTIGLYKWQLPLAAPFDPTNPQTSPVNELPAGSTQPHPELPPEHPLNMKPPLIPNEGDNDEPDTPPALGAGGANGDSGSVAPGGGTDTGDASSKEAVLALALKVILAMIEQQQPLTTPLETKRVVIEEDKRTQAMLPFLAAAQAMEEARHGKH
jgi:hypothetical protein